MIDRHKQDESIGQSGYLAAVFPTKKSQANLISKLYLQQSKRIANRSYQLLDTRSKSHRSDIAENRPYQKSKSFKKYIKIKKQSKTCIQQMKITPFQNWKMKEKQTSQKKLASANITKTAPQELQQSKRKWLIVQQVETFSPCQSAKKLLRQEIKRIKCGIQNMRDQIQAEKHKNESLINTIVDNDKKKYIGQLNVKQKAATPSSTRQKMVKQRIKRNVCRAKIEQNYSQKIKNNFLKQINQKNSQINQLSNLCIFSQKYVLVNNTSNDKSLNLAPNSSLQTEEQYKSPKNHQFSSINKPQIEIVGVYLNNNRIIKHRQKPWLQQFGPNSRQKDSNSMNNFLRERDFQKVIGWEGVNRHNIQKQIYP